jgi:hypothetical protein
MAQSYYYCKECGSASIRGSQPHVKGCSKGTWHAWYHLGNVGSLFTYQCSKCGIGVVMDGKPNRNGCPRGYYHLWQRVS